MKILSQGKFRKFEGFICQGLSEELYRVTVNGNDIKATKDHRFLIDGEWVSVENIANKEQIPNEIVYDAFNVSETNSYTTNGAESHNCNLIYIDEFAHIENDIAFYESTYPTISSGKNTQVIITSTPKGLNLFYHLWSNAMEGRNEFKTLAYDWSVVPGRDEKWKEETIANTSPVQFAQEFECVTKDTIVDVRCSVSEIERKMTVAELIKIQESGPGCVYMITRTDGKQYIGATKDLKKRMGMHKNHKRFSMGISSVEVLYSGLYLECVMLEEHFIKRYNTFEDGLNETPHGKGKNGDCGFSTFGFKYSDESKNRMKDSARKRAIREKENGIKRKGPTFTKEVLEKFSRDRKGKVSYSIMSLEDRKKFINRYLSWKNEFLQNTDFSPFWHLCKVSLQEDCRNGKIKNIEDFISGNGKVVPLQKIFVHYFCEEELKILKAERLGQILGSTNNA